VRYADAHYDKLEFALEGQKRLSHKVDGLLTAGFARRNYDHPFDERDNNTYSVSAGVDVGVHPRINISLLLNMDLSYASGADSTDPAVADVSNNRYGFELGGRWRIKHWLRFEQTFDYGHQTYTSGNIADISHHDRTDNEFETASTLRMGSFSGWQPSAFFEYRTSNSSVRPGIAEFGQYTAYRTGAQLTYYF
jgi:hypothetical protein